MRGACCVLTALKYHFSQEEVFVMKLKIINKTIMFLVAAVFLLSGCATDQPRPTKRYVFPRPPDPPKIEWLKTYYSVHDFPKSGFQSTMENLFGAEPAIAFDKPIDIKANGKGVVYVTDIIAEAIFVYDLVNYKVTLWRKNSAGNDGLGITPYYISLDADGNIYAVGAGEKKIYVLNSSGSVVRTIDFTGKIVAVAGIAFDESRQRIYLVDTKGCKIEVFSKAGEHLFSFGKPGDGNGELNRPSPIAINRKGEVVVGDTMNGRVQIFDGDGKFLRKFGQRGDGNAEFQVLKGLSVDSDDNIYVTDGKANQIKIYNTTGDFLLGIGKAHSVPYSQVDAPGGFLLPQGIYIDGTDTIYVADQANNRFVILKYLKDEPKPASDAGVKKVK